MSVLTPPVPTPLQGMAGVPNDLIWRLSVDQYHEMINSGILTNDDPVELLDGWLVVKMPKKPPHILVTELTREVLDRLMPPNWFTNSQEPVTIKTSEPEPDISVVRGDRRQYRDRHPGPADIGMLVEVSDTTLARDQGWKKQVYARAQIPVYWIVNLVQNQVEAYTDPTGPAETPDYGQKSIYGLADEAPVVLDGKEIGRLPVRTLLP